MNKADLTIQVAKDAELTQIQAASAVDAVLNAVQNTLKTGDSVTLVGFGAFSVADRAARTGRNPQTGEEIKIAETRVARFKAGKALKEAVAMKPKKKAKQKK